MKLISEIDRRRLQSGKYKFSCSRVVKDRTFYRIFALVCVVVIMAMIGSGVYIGTLIK